ncbi:hypothetical protein MKX03_015738 [Papaver bracteatum]|nr:hypothetical protein MKX03_015738 [Papaver bracteatum]
MNKTELGSLLGARRLVFAVKKRKRLVKDLVTDIDKKDLKNPFAVVEYVDELQKFYKISESSSQSSDYMDLQTEIDEDMRMSLVHCLFQFHMELKFTPGIFFLAINLLDRYLSFNLVSRKEFPLLGLTCLVMAGKYEDASAKKVEKFVRATDGVYCKKEIRDMEILILKKLGWNLAVPTVYHFLVRCVKAAEADKEMEKTIFFMAVLGVMQYKVIKSYSPSLIAASSVYAANCVLKKDTLWNATVQHYTGFCESQVIECSKRLVEMSRYVVLSEKGISWRYDVR